MSRLLTIFLVFAGGLVHQQAGADETGTQETGKPAIVASDAVVEPLSVEHIVFNDLSGTWQGTWTSCKSGHKGPMKAKFCRLKNGDYRVNFRGRFFKIFPFRYSVVLKVVEEGDVVKLSGSSYLGRMFGTFCYSATADACQFRADYTSKKDHGVFSLKRN